jgi:hypothetical protein
MGKQIVSSFLEGNAIFGPAPPLGRAPHDIHNWAGLTQGAPAAIHSGFR